MVILFATLLAILLVISEGGEGWHSDSDSHSDSHSHSHSSSHDIDYVKAYIKCQKGMINMWFGKICKDSLPFGWELCDGENGTPDLRDRFPVGAGKKYEYGETGGNTEGKIELTVNQLPWHKHKIWAKDMIVSVAPKHKHWWGKGAISPNGGHWHKAGDLTMDKHLGHTHWFKGNTSFDGGHIHNEHDYMTDDESDHTHDIYIASEYNGSHSHGHNLDVTRDGSNHSHTITVEMQAIPDHRHSLNSNYSYVNVKIPGHWHGAGDYSINDHCDTHNHSIWGHTEMDGKHKHAINFTIAGGTHLHDMDLMTNEVGDHNHSSGNLYAVDVRNHTHWVPKINTTQDGDHDHAITAYEHSSWLTKNETWGLALDCVNQGQPWNISTNDDEEDGHIHEVPGRWTGSAGGHGHRIANYTGINGKHHHNISGSTWNHESHQHIVDGETFENGSEHQHHHIRGKTDIHYITFTHIISGRSGLGGAWDGKFNLTGWTTKSGGHTPTGTATIDGSDGKHIHGLNGDILGGGNHRHWIDGASNPGSSHKHNVIGSCGGDTDGLHKHAFDGMTNKRGMHKHNISGTSEYVANHTHSIDIVIYGNGNHTHNVSGITKGVGRGDEIDINPPYVAVWFICCTLEKSPSFSWSASSSSDSNHWPWHKDSDSDSNHPHHWHKTSTTTKIPETSKPETSKPETSNTMIGEYR